MQISPSFPSVTPPITKGPLEKSSQGETCSPSKTNKPLRRSISAIRIDSLVKETLEQRGSYIGEINLRENSDSKEETRGDQPHSSLQRTIYIPPETTRFIIKTATPSNKETSNQKEEKGKGGTKQFEITLIVKELYANASSTTDTGSVKRSTSGSETVLDDSSMVGNVYSLSLKESAHPSPKTSPSKPHTPPSRPHSPVGDAPKSPPSRPHSPPAESPKNSDRLLALKSLFTRASSRDGGMRSSGASSPKEDKSEDSKHSPKGGNQSPKLGLRKPPSATKLRPPSPFDPAKMSLVINKESPKENHDSQIVSVDTRHLSQKESPKKAASKKESPKEPKRIVKDYSERLAPESSITPPSFKFRIGKKREKLSDSQVEDQLKKALEPSDILLNLPPFPEAKNYQNKLFSEVLNRLKIMARTLDEIEDKCEISSQAKKLKGNLQWLLVDVSYNNGNNPDQIEHFIRRYNSAMKTDNHLHMQAFSIELINFAIGGKEKKHAHEVIDYLAKSLLPTDSVRHRGLIKKEGLFHRHSRFDESLLESLHQTLENTHITVPNGGDLHIQAWINCLENIRKFFGEARQLQDIRLPEIMALDLKDLEELLNKVRSSTSCLLGPFIGRILALKHAFVEYMKKLDKTSPLANELENLIEMLIKCKSYLNKNDRKHDTWNNLRSFLKILDIDVDWQKPIGRLIYHTLTGEKKPKKLRNSLKIDDPKEIFDVWNYWDRIEPDQFRLEVANRVYEMANTNNISSKLLDWDFNDLKPEEKTSPNCDIVNRTLFCHSEGEKANPNRPCPPAVNLNQIIFNGYSFPLTLLNENQVEGEKDFYMRFLTLLYKGTNSLPKPIFDDIRDKTYAGGFDPGTTQAEIEQHVKDLMELEHSISTTLLLWTGTINSEPYRFRFFLERFKDFRQKFETVQDQGTVIWDISVRNFRSYSGARRCRVCIREPHDKTKILASFTQEVVTYPNYRFPTFPGGLPAYAGLIAMKDLVFAKDVPYEKRIQVCQLLGFPIRTSYPEQEIILCNSESTKQVPQFFPTPRLEESPSAAARQEPTLSLLPEDAKGKKKAPDPKDNSSL